MPPREWTLRISDMLDAIAKIQRYTSNISFNEFSADDRTIDAVVRNFEIIGEAARHVPEPVQLQYSDVPWSEMIGMHSFVIHQYAVVSITIVSETIQQDLLPLAPRLREILNQTDEGGKAE